MKSHLIAVGAGAVLAALVVGLGQEWRHQAMFAQIERDVAKSEAREAAATLAELQDSIKSIADAASRAASVAPQLTAQVGQLSKALNDATPLLDGCRPDNQRVRILTDAVRATNSAAAGQEPR